MWARSGMILAFAFACKGGSGEWVAPNVVINEFVASNATGYQDESGAYPDWIELANLEDEEVDLSTYTLTDDSALPQKWSFPAGSIIPAEGFLIVFADGDPSTINEIHTTYRLEQQGEEILLIGPAGEDLPIIDEVSFDVQTTDVSMARLPNGDGPFATDDSPTPGAAND